jgi:hypothetical protein
VGTVKKSKLKKAKKGPAAKPATFEEKQVAAYHLWQKRGSPHGDDMTDWLAVERRAEEEEIEWNKDERSWDEENPQDDEPGEVP